jgi:hypothetical protein
MPFLHLGLSITLDARKTLYDVVTSAYATGCASDHCSQSSLFVALGAPAAFPHYERAHWKATTIIGIEIGQVAGGTVVFETIFGLPGMGCFMLVAINQRDYPVVQEVNLLLATIIVLVNLLVDLTYAYLDPRIRYR